jgi:hypothetical protein
MKPEDFGVDVKFCLNEATKKYREDYKNNKLKMINMNCGLKDRKLTSNKNNQKSYKEKNHIIEGDEKEKRFSDNVIKNNRDNFNALTEACDLDIYTMPKTKANGLYIYLNEFNDKNQNKIEKDILNTNISDYFSVFDERKSINNIDDIDRNLIISEVESTRKTNQFLLNFARTFSNVYSYDEEKLNDPYYEVIKTLKNIINFKSPLDKMMIMASLSSFITDSIYKYWKPIEDIINMSILNLDVDDLMKILKYIVYKSGMSSLFIHLDFVKYFTIPETKSTMIGYYYTLLEGIFNSFLSVKNKNDFLKI